MPDLASFLSCPACPASCRARLDRASMPFVDPRVEPEDDKTEASEGDRREMLSPWVTHPICHARLDRASMPSVDPRIKSEDDKARGVASEDD